MVGTGWHRIRKRRRHLARLRRQRRAESFAVPDIDRSMLRVPKGYKKSFSWSDTVYMLIVGGVGRAYGMPGSMVVRTLWGLGELVKDE